MTTFRIEQTTTGLKVRAITITPTGKEKTRIVGRVGANDYEGAERLIDSYSAVK